MAEYGRHSVLSGQSLDLRVIFRDDANILVDPDSTPSVYIYDESVDTETIESEIDAATFTSALAGPLVPTALSTGFYELTYTVPGGSNEGTWHDVWVAAIDGVDSTDYLAFEVDTAADLSTQELLDNELIVIQLDDSISNSAGDETLVTDQTLSFTTTYNPLYASPDLVRMTVGTMVDYIPDATLALMIHWASREVDFIRPPSICNRADFDFAKTKFVVYDAALKAMLLPAGESGSGSASSADGTKKQLGDLMIDRSGGSGSSTVAVTSSGVDVVTLEQVTMQRDEWWRVVNSGACIVPGQGFEPETAIRSRWDPDRRASGRLWLNPEYGGYPQPGANAKLRLRGHNRGRFGYTDWRRQLSRSRLYRRRF